MNLYVCMNVCTFYVCINVCMYEYMCIYLYPISSIISNCSQQGNSTTSNLYYFNNIAITVRTFYYTLPAKRLERFPMVTINQ